MRDRQMSAPWGWSVVTLHRPIAVQGALPRVGGGRGGGVSELGGGAPHPDTVIIRGRDQDLKTSGIRIK